MNKTLEIGGRELVLQSNAGTALFYKRVFKKDIINAITKVQDEEDLEVIDRITELCFIMAKQGEGNGIDKMLALTEKDFFEWVCSFDSSAFMDANIVMQVIAVWQSSNNVTSELKNA